MKFDETLIITEPFMQKVRQIGVFQVPNETLIRIDETLIRIDKALIKIDETLIKIDETLIHEELFCAKSTANWCILSNKRDPN